MEFFNAIATAFSPEHQRTSKIKDIKYLSLQSLLGKSVTRLIFSVVEVEKASQPIIRMTTCPAYSSDRWAVKINVKGMNLHAFDRSFSQPVM